MAFWNKKEKKDNTVDPILETNQMVSGVHEHLESILSVRHAELVEQEHFLAQVTKSTQELAAEVEQLENTIALLQSLKNTTAPKVEEVAESAES